MNSLENAPTSIIFGFATNVTRGTEINPDLFSGINSLSFDKRRELLEFLFDPHVRRVEEGKMADEDVVIDVMRNFDFKKYIYDAQSDSAVLDVYIDAINQIAIDGSQTNDVNYILGISLVDLGDGIKLYDYFPHVSNTLVLLEQELTALQSSSPNTSLSIKIRNHLALVSDSIQPETQHKIIDIPEMVTPKVDLQPISRRVNQSEASRNFHKVPISEVISMYRDNKMRVSQIAKQFGVHPKTVIVALLDAGVNVARGNRSNFKASPEQIAMWLALPDEEIISMYIDQRLSLRRIGRPYGISEHGVWGRLFRAGFTDFRPERSGFPQAPVKNLKRLQDLTGEELKQLYEDSSTIKELSEKLGVSVNMVGKRLNEKHIPIRYTTGGRLKRKKITESKE